MNFTIIAAMNLRGAIGKNNGLIWHSPIDMQHFKKTTDGCPVIMGYKTFESIGCKPLPNRPNIVLTTHMRASQAGVYYVGTYNDAILMAKSFHAKTTYICGGESVYAQALAHPETTGIILSLIADLKKGDAYFPAKNIFANFTISRFGLGKWPFWNDPLFSIIHFTKKQK